ncbi:NADAR family protein [Hymenobacter volaticus]|uniref:NADAR family protein n=1 Tax=Hymenobacter volaticus TaxID=2932254 RepID=A0ABY4G5R2_9BACT|nr:NADAR family protein [Hymenobacter volaticus]UOQ66239.1 NADAR family protein [Hymenobacter volaticus]
MSATLPPIRSVESLRQHLEAGHNLKYVFFWGHTGQPGGVVGKECFSQWYPAAFTLDGDTYATTEHYMMAEKARLFGDEVTRTAILTATHPNEAKKLGRTVQNFDASRWEAARFNIVVQGNVAKFSQHPTLREFLRQTGSRVLVEASPVDAIWGIGLAQDSPHASNPAEWQGLNLLGFALMEVREQLAD